MGDDLVISALASVVAIAAFLFSIFGTKWVRRQQAGVEARHKAVEGLNGDLADCAIMGAEVRFQVSQASDARFRGRVSGGDPASIPKMCERFVESRDRVKHNQVVFAGHIREVRVRAWGAAR